VDNGASAIVCVVPVLSRAEFVGDVEFASVINLDIQPKRGWSSASYRLISVGKRTFGTGCVGGWLKIPLSGKRYRPVGYLEFFFGVGGFNKFSWGQRAERTGIWGR
jgi:hypothetical protein